MSRFEQPPSGETSDTIVPLNAFRARPAVNALRLVEGYWTALRQEGALPTRTDVDPRGLANVLEYVFILERIAPGLARFRIAGSHLSALTGMEVRGMPISSLFVTPARHRVASMLDRCFDEPAVIETSLTAKPNGRGAVLDGQMILLPMTCDMGRVSRVLGALVVHDAPRQGTFKFDSWTYSAKPVFGLATPEPTQTPAPVAGMAEDAASFMHAVPKLRLVYSRDEASPADT